jgi:hypothetical protein
MYGQKIIWSWILFIVAMLVHSYLETYESKMMALFLFRDVNRYPEEGIEQDRIYKRSFDYFWYLSSIRKTH